MRTLLPLIFSFLFLSTAEGLVVQVGERAQLPANGEVWQSKTRAFSIKDLGTKLLITGLAAGAGKIKVGKDVIEINVLTSSQKLCFEKLTLLARQSLAIKVEVKSGTLLVKGTPLSLHEWQKIRNSMKNSDCQFSTEFLIQHHASVTLQRAFNKLAITEGWPPSRLHLERGQVEIPAGAADNTPFIGWLRSWGLEPILTKNAVSLAPMVRLRIAILEVKKNARELLGLDWSTDAHFQILPKSGFSSEFGFDAHLFESRGWGKILASPNLLCRSGKAAEFLAGGEIPISVRNYKSHEVIWKKYGVLLKVQPEVDNSGNMSLSLETEISTPDGSHNGDGVPGFLTNRVQSHFDLTEPRTILLSGLIKYQESLNQPKVSGLSDIPILGTLFQSQDYQQNQSELMIVVYPQVVSPNGEQL